MKNLFFCLTALFLCSFTNMGHGQDGLPSCIAKSPSVFTECAAIFLNHGMLVDDYSPKGKCVVAQDATGTLSVSTTEINPYSSVPFISVGFKVAIRNKKTNTLWLYSEDTFMSVDLKKIIGSCSEGDEILIMTMDKTYALPHNTIEIRWGC